MDKLRQYTLLIGLNDKDTHKRIVNKTKAKELIMSICGDCTISDAVGHYTHDNGSEVVEKSLRVEILFRELDEVLNFCKQIKQELNQESVALSYQDINSMLV